MKVGIMQPYIFPYIGYFQLINAVDTFVFYDDVNFIKGGWINRNRILLNNASHIFTIPLKGQSSFNRICETKIDIRQFDCFKVKFLKTLNQCYIKAPYFEDVFPLIENFFLSNRAEYISEIAISSILLVSDYLELNTEFEKSSNAFSDTQELKKADRLIAITKKENAEFYINLAGGKEIYSREQFETHNIKLEFIKPNPVIYSQFRNQFVPYLSIIDVLMFNSKNNIDLMLNSYKLV